MKNYKDYIFWRVYISLITVCSLLYIIFISFLAFHNNNKKNDFFQDRTLTMETILKNKFEMINVYATQIKSHEKFIKFIYEEEIDYYNLTKLQQELKKNNTLMYKLGYSIAVKKDSEDVIVNAMNTSPSISFYKNLGIAESPEFINKKLQNLKMYETLVYDTRDNLVYFYRDYDNNYVNKFIWIIILDKIEFFRNVPVFENFTLNIKNDNKELFIFGHKNPKNILNERNSQKNLFGNEFVFIEEDMSLSKKVFYIVFVILIPIVLLGLVLYYISKSVSRSLYSPIKGLKKNLDMSDKDSIMLIENTYKKIKEQNEFLKEKAENLDLRYREKQVRDYLVGISVKRPEILKEINYGIFVVQITDDDRYEENYSKEYILALKTRIEIELDKLKNGKFLDIDYNHICYLYENDEKITEEKFSEILNRIIEEFKIDIRGTLEKNIPVENLNKTYKKLRKLLEFKNDFVTDVLISSENLDSIQEHFYYYSFEVERKFVKKISLGNLQGALEIFEDIFEENISNRKLDMENLLDLKAQLINTGRRILEQKGVKYNFDSLAKVKEIVEFKEFYIEFIEKMCEKSETYQDKAYLKEAIEKYLDEHYREDISLEILSDHMGFSSKYLSVLFKQLIGQNFKVVLDEKRVEKAKELLVKNPEIKVQELASLCGFNSANTFIRVFKKYEGISPGNFNKEN